MLDRLSCNDSLRVDEDVEVVVIGAYVHLDVGGDGVDVGIGVRCFRYWFRHRYIVLCRYWCLNLREEKGFRAFVKILKLGKKNLTFSIRLHIKCLHRDGVHYIFNLR
jgi:hypothetical protein